MSEKVNPRAPSYVPVLVGSRRSGVSLLSTLFSDVHPAEPKADEARFPPDTASSGSPLIDVDGAARPSGHDPAEG